MAEQLSPTGTSTPPLLLRGAQVMLPGGPEDTDVVIAGGTIAEIGTGLRADRSIEADGLVLAPAMIDLHGDAFERQVMPRPGVFVPLDTAILETDRQLGANGIATAYHAITLGWAPGLRSVERGHDMLAALRQLGPRLTVENRVQLRWETFALEAMDLIADALEASPTPSLAFNDHTSMMMRAFDLPVQQRAFEHAPDFAAADPGDPRMEDRVKKDAERAGLSPRAYIGRMTQLWNRRAEVPAAIGKLAALAQTAGVPMLSHDDTRIETREFYRHHGSAVAEFPMTLSAAKAARDGGDKIIFGAPNVLRGGSHIGSLTAADMVEAGLCDALASDYFYPSMLAAVGRLHEERRGSLRDLWALVSDGPAQAMGLSDRGRIEAGLRADLVLVDWPASGAPAIRATFSQGRAAYAGTPAACPTAGQD